MTEVETSQANKTTTFADDKLVRLLSSDKLEVEVKKSHILMSGLIKDMLEEGDDGEGDSAVAIIPVPNVKGKILERVVKYCDYHWNNPAEEIEKPLKGKIEDVICEWDNKFLEVEQSDLIELIMAANYLNIKDLLDLTCGKVASMVKGKSPEVIREMFGIENDFTPEEEEKIREENKWCEDA